MNPNNIMIKHYCKLSLYFLPIGQSNSDNSLTNVTQFVNVEQVVKSSYGHRSIVSTECLVCMYYSNCHRGHSIMISHVLCHLMSRGNYTYIHVHHIQISII